MDNTANMGFLVHTNVKPALINYGIKEILEEVFSALKDIFLPLEIKQK